MGLDEAELHRCIRGASNCGQEASYGVRKGRESRLEEQPAIAERLGGETWMRFDIVAEPLPRLGRRIRDGSPCSYRAGREILRFLRHAPATARPSMYGMFRPFCNGS